ncbi:MAG: DNA-directed RNA polymerase subunit beta' [Firmicutes bacterium]|nr:DNA-directed RNA polymerase subunit beta' [Bacillota bacterium]MCR4709788.1 DNA-directed RNA polymerase subunit beta' [Clostridiales bacterium]
MNNQNVDKDYELNNFESIQISLASPDKILEWSYGEVTKPETINYRTLKPERDGLFCERIFGPMKDWECHCGKYKRIRYKGIICDRCGVEVTKAKVRRERMGHIKLAAPVSHIWYFKGTPSRMGLCLDITPRNLERVLYFASYIVTDPGDTNLAYKQILSESEYREAKEVYGSRFKAGMGAEAVRKLLEDIDLDELSEDLRAKLKDATGQKKLRIGRRLEVIEALRMSGNRPEWMVLTVIPVIPPDIRPMVQLDGGRFATSDLNDLYRRVINRNNRLNRLLELGAPDIIVRNEKRMLQEAVDSLIDNGRRGRAVTGPGSRALKSLSDMLKGKQGRFRQNLLGKRVDYSGRSVIVVGPELKFYQCGLPKKMALELFKPFIMKELVEQGYSHNIKQAKRMVEKVRPEVWDVLEGVIKEHPVMLNRAPTLHRLGIQAFEPVLVEGKAIKLHPLVCTAFNADFDGDQMAVHVPLSVEAQAEARFLMLSVNNILAPKDGSPITTPTQDMILGAYYLTYPGVMRMTDANGKVHEKLDDFKEHDDGFVRVPEKGDGKVFTDMDEMLMAYQTGSVHIHARVKVRIPDAEGLHGESIVESTVGRFIYNQGIPQDLGFVDREADPFGLEVDFLCGKKELGKIIDKCFKKHGNTGTVLMLDYIKSMGYKYSTKAAVTISVADMEIPEEKGDIVAAAETKVDKYERAFRAGLISNQERYEKVVEIWNAATDEVADALMDSLAPLNNLQIMAHSGARGSKNQIRQVGGMRGLMANATGKTVEVPIKSNFREGLSILEYFISSNGARKGLADTALRTADSGYLTRRLVDVSHNVIVREYDCGTDEGVEVQEFKDGKETIEPLVQRITGRTALVDIVDPNTGEVIVEQNEEILEADAEKIKNAGITSVAIRSVMTCHSKTGICAKCYGRNLATGEEVNIGESVGIIAAQSIGEPGTQLTMRTFHSGGVAGGDITQGLPRVEELFEARKPKGLAEICEGDGEVVSIEARQDNKTEVIVKEADQDRTYVVPYGARINVKVGEKVYAGQNITRGPLDPHDILRLNGVEGVYQYLLKEVQRVYKLQGVDINDKHIEVIVSQMLSKYKVEDSGDTSLLPGSLYNKFEIEEANNEALAKGGEPAEFKITLQGITKAALATGSFLSAASFQETTKVLTDAAIKGKNDKLVGLKENVIIGKLIPAGTGMKRYRNITLDYGVNAEIMENYEREQELKRREEEARLAMADSAEDDMDETEMMEDTPEVQDEVEAVEEIVELD